MQQQSLLLLLSRSSVQLATINQDRTHQLTFHIADDAALTKRRGCCSGRCMRNRVPERDVHVLERETIQVFTLSVVTLEIAWRIFSLRVLRYPLPCPVVRLDPSTYIVHPPRLRPLQQRRRRYKLCTCHDPAARCLHNNNGRD
jgi:hypothetical protein